MPGNRLVCYQQSLGISIEMQLRVLQLRQPLPTDSPLCFLFIDPNETWHISSVHIQNVIFLAQPDIAFIFLKDISVNLTISLLIQLKLGVFSVNMPRFI